LIRVSHNHRFLVHPDGTPFFYLGDTAWELFHRCTLHEAEMYLRDRAAKGFTVIQAVALAELDGLTLPNPNGDLPLIDHDPSRPNEAYFRHVDAIVDLAAALGLYIGLLPTWGDKWHRLWGVGPEIFTPENARTYGRWLGQRYKDAPIIWILGGDRPVESETHRLILRAMARGAAGGRWGQPPDGLPHLGTALLLRLPARGRVARPAHVPERPHPQHRQLALDRARLRPLPHQTLHGCRARLRGHGLPVQAGGGLPGRLRCAQVPLLGAVCRSSRSHLRLQPRVADVAAGKKPHAGGQTLLVRGPPSCREPPRCNMPAGSCCPDPTSHASRTSPSSSRRWARAPTMSGPPAMPTAPTSWCTSPPAGPWTSI